MLNSCERKNNRLEKYLENYCSSPECGNTECEVKMENIINEDWDYVYVFFPEDSLEKINTELGFEYQYWEDIGTRIIFVKNNKVIYHEDEFPNPEKSEKLVFTDLKNNLLKISREKANFTSRIVKGSFYLTLNK